jgi:hypothetical protein
MGRKSRKPIRKNVIIRRTCMESECHLGPEGRAELQNQSQV